MKRVMDHGSRIEEAAHAAGVSVRTAYKWPRRFREEGLAGLRLAGLAPAQRGIATPEANAAFTL